MIIGIVASPCSYEDLVDLCDKGTSPMRLAVIALLLLILAREELNHT